MSTSGLFLLDADDFASTTVLSKLDKRRWLLSICLCQSVHQLALNIVLEQRRVNLQRLVTEHVLNDTRLLLIVLGRDLEHLQLVLALVR